MSKQNKIITELKFPKFYKSDFFLFASLYFLESSSLGLNNV